MPEETTIKLKKHTRDVISNIKKMNNYDSYDTLINVLVKESESQTKRLRKIRLI